MLDPSLNSLVLGSVLLSRSEDLKPSLIENFIKFVISTKTKAQPHVLRSLQPLLKSLNHDEFKGQILPAMSKAMLRNPELVMESISLILSSLSIDLSQYVGDLSKPFATQLHANDDMTRESAIKCVASLGLKASDSEAVDALLKAIFAVLNGSEGKLSVAGHKMSLLSAAAALADNSMLGKNSTVKGRLRATIFKSADTAHLIASTKQHNNIRCIFSAD